MSEINVTVEQNRVINVTLGGNVGPRGPKGDQGDPGPQGTVITVSETPPPDPNVGDLWVDSS